MSKQTTTYRVSIVVTQVTEWKDGATSRWMTKPIQENVISGNQTKSKAKCLSRALQDRAQDCIEEVR